MTLQELFTLAWDHFVVKKGPPSFDAVERICRYRGPNGEKCLIGLAIPDSEYTRRMDNAGGIHGLAYESPSFVQKLFPGVPVGDLSRLQMCHDEAAYAGGSQFHGEEFLNRIAARLRTAAGEMGLKVPA